MAKMPKNAAQFVAPTVSRAYARAPLKTNIFAGGSHRTLRTLACMWSIVVSRVYSGIQSAALKTAVEG